MNARPAPPAPEIDLDTAPFWQAADRRELRLCRCAECAAYLHPPLERCKWCGAPTEFVPSSGAGSIYSFIIVRHPSVPAYADKIPYVLAIVELDEGIRLPGLLLDENGTGVEIGQQVRAEIVEIPGAEHHSVAFRRS